MDTKNFATLASFTDMLLDAICVVDTDGYFVFIGAACERIFGYRPDEMVGRNMIEFVAPEDRARTLQAANSIMSGRPMPHFENRYVRKDGQLVHIMWSARWSEADRLRIAVARDVTERKQAELMQAALYEISEAAHVAEDLPGLFRQIHQIIGKLLPALNFSVVLHDDRHQRLSFPYHVDEYDSKDLALRQSAIEVFCEEIIRTRQSRLLRADLPHAFPHELHALVDAEAVSVLGVPLNTQRGTIGALVLTSYAGGVHYTEREKELLQFVSTQVATAIERKQLYARLQHTAHHDILTNLPNRGLLYDRLESALARVERQHGKLALLFLDLNGFKRINDEYGHSAGDLLLQEVASRLLESVRHSDTVARIGGDEFVVLLESVHLQEHITSVVEKVRGAFDRPFDLDGYHVEVTPSIGIAQYPEHGDRVQQLLKHADNAMYAAKWSQPDGTRRKEISDHSCSDSAANPAPGQAG
ncbi:sensor domain-containing protein [Noviherbaspirillum sp. Root189]|uniref:sensor domain-containing protein n=1 Tax=Noviherbaspirillum sp. Root189 TaxID=1736487 RepID=UPI00070A775F|nr:GGDEF domain-containing protein [Noviherbaspirillum sp. Root189]KRB88627.1 diguanylate cyclase [Noviherbaspirillum sp. Root189]